MDILLALGPVVVIVIILLVLFLLSGLRVVNQYERGVIFVLGRLDRREGAGRLLGATVHQHDAQD